MFRFQSLHLLKITGTGLQRKTGMFVIKAVGQQQYAAVEQRGHGAESLKPLQLITVDADAVAFGLVNAAAYDRPIFLP